MKETGRSEALERDKRDVMESVNGCVALEAGCDGTCEWRGSSKNSATRETTWGVC